jgi:hypothetical protein
MPDSEQLPMQRIHLACGALALAFCFACGGSSAKNAAPAENNALTLSTGPLVDGVEWQLNRPIDLTFDRAVDFASVTLASVVVESEPGAVAVAGSYEVGIDPTTGVSDARIVRFQPHCPIASGDAGGFAQSGAYRLVVRGEDSTAFPVRAQDGTALASTVAVSFATPTSSDPAVLFHDSVVGAPRVVFRGRQGVPIDDLQSTRFEIGHEEQTRVELRASAFGGVVVDPGSLALVPNGLPLNHIIEPKHHIALVVEFDQPVRLEPANLERLELQFLDATWSVVPCEVEARSGCGRRGSTVSVRPLATLPPGAALRLVLAAGFSDLVGEVLTNDAVEVLPLAGTTAQDSNGARVDALFESFQVGGNQSGSMEDTTSDLGAPRGYWGSGFAAGVVTCPRALPSRRGTPSGSSSQLEQRVLDAGVTRRQRTLDDHDRARLSTSRIGMPAIGPVASRAAGFTTSLAPTTMTTSVFLKSPLIDPSPTAGRTARPTRRAARSCGPACGRRPGGSRSARCSRA